MSYLVIYHKNCMDGLAAALAVRQHLWDTRQMAGAKFQTAQYGDPPPPDVTGRDVIIVDFSYDRETLLRLNEQAKSLLVIDHHETARDNLAGLDFCTFDMTKSGAVLTWEHFHPREPLPLLMQYVQDRDLWQWRLPFSREVSAALASYKPFLDQMTRYLDDTEIAGLISQGAAILRYQQQQIDRTTIYAPAWVEIGGYSVACTNTTTLISELGEALLAKYPESPFVAMYLDTNDGKLVFSLRTNDERIAANGIKVNEVAAQYGGGGHPQAAGFSIDRPAIL